MKKYLRSIVYPILVWFFAIALVVVTGWGLVSCKDQDDTPEITLVGITVNAQPNKTEYAIGEELDMTGLVVIAAYSDGSSETVTEYSISGYNKNTIGEQTITVTYKDKTTTFNVIVLKKVITPIALPEAGIYNEAQSVSLKTTTEDAKIYYTTDGTNPTEASTEYTSEISVEVTTTIKAIAVKDDMKNSDILTAVFTLQVIKPIVSVATGTYTEVQNVTLTNTTEGAKIYYTINGENPTTSSTLYTSTININTTTTLKAVAVKDSWTNSEILTAVYTINIFTNVPVLTLTERNSDLQYVWTPSIPASDSYDIYWKLGSGLNEEAVKKGTKIEGAISGGFITGLQGGMTYSVLVTANKQGFNSVDSGVVTKTTLVCAAMPTISVQPQGGSFLKTGTTLSVTASVTDGGMLAYQWYSNKNNNTVGGTAIVGAKESSYTTPNDFGTYYYYVIITNTINDNGDGGSKTATTTSNVAEVSIELAVTEWARSVIGSSSFNAVAVDASGNIYAAGSGNSNVILVKYNSSGTELWAKTVIAGNGYLKFNAVAVDVSGNIYAAGYQYGNGNYTYGTGVSAQGSYPDGRNVILVKYDSNGIAQWAKSVSTGGNAGGYSYESDFEGVAVDASGNVYAAGWQASLDTFTYGTEVSVKGCSSLGSIVLVKYDSSGTALWAKSAKYTPLSGFNAVAVDSSGNVYAVGYHYYRTTSYFGDSFLGMEVSATGKYDGKNDLMIKYDSNGIAQWAKSGDIATNGATEFTAVVVDSSNNVCASGLIGSYGSTLIKYNSSGSVMWSKVVGVNENNSGISIAVDVSGNVYTAGYIYIRANYVNNVILVKYDSSGTALWTKTVIAGNGNSSFNAVAVDAFGNIYAAGYQYGNCTYGTGVSVQGSYSGEDDAVLVKYRN